MSLYPVFGLMLGWFSPGDFALCVINPSLQLAERLGGRTIGLAPAFAPRGRWQRACRGGWPLSDYEQSLRGPFFGDVRTQHARLIST